MKTWTQLSALAKRQGLKLGHGDRTFTLRDTSGSSITWGDVWAGGARQASGILRAMCGAALEQMGRAK